MYQFFHDFLYDSNTFLGTMYAIIVIPLSGAAVYYLWIKDRK